MSEEVNNTIVVGHSVPKPVITQEECDAYSAMAQAVNEHNSTVNVGEAYWTILDEEDCYKVAEGETRPEPGDPEPTLDERLAALQTAQEDTDAMTVDQEYRLTLLELGIDDTTDNT